MMHNYPISGLCLHHTVVLVSWFMISLHWQDWKVLKYLFCFASHLFLFLIIAFLEVVAKLRLCGSNILKHYRYKFLHSVSTRCVFSLSSDAGCAPCSNNIRRKIGTSTQTWRWWIPAWTWRGLVQDLIYHFLFHIGQDPSDPNFCTLPILEMKLGVSLWGTSLTTLSGMFLQTTRMQRSLLLEWSILIGGGLGVFVLSVLADVGDSPLSGIERGKWTPVVSRWQPIYSSLDVVNTTSQTPHSSQRECRGGQRGRGARGGRGYKKMMWCDALWFFLLTVQLERGFLCYPNIVQSGVLTTPRLPSS